MARSMLPATLSPMVAMWLAGRHGDEMREMARLYAKRGIPDISRQFLVALGQLEAAAAQLSFEAVSIAATSASGNAETEIGPALAESELSTPQAAERLGLTRERVCQLLKSGDLLGRKAGRAWRVLASSVDDLNESRRAA